MVQGGGGSELMGPEHELVGDVRAESLGEVEVEDGDVEFGLTRT